MSKKLSKKEAAYFKDLIRLWDDIEYVVKA
jgi:hypothetical protein